MVKKTEMKLELHDNTKYLECCLRHLKAHKGEICAQDYDLLLRFQQAESARGISPRRQAKYLYLLVYIRKWLGCPFEAAKEGDFLRMVSQSIENNPNYSAWSKHDFKLGLLRFYSWLHSTRKGERPPGLEFVSLAVKVNETVSPEEILTEQDITAMVAAAKTIKTKAFIGCLYESAARISEFMTLRLRNVVFDSYGALVQVRGKTGTRKIRLVWMSPYLREWVLQYHPRKDDPDAPLWPSAQARAAIPTYTAVCKTLRRNAIAAGIKKKVRPHLFRHSRLTALARKLSDSQLKAYAGWTAASKMAGVYVHLSAKDVDSAILGLYGLRDACEAEVPRVKSCPFCGTRNMPEAVNCINKECGMILDMQVWKAEQERQKEKFELVYQTILEHGAEIKTLKNASQNKETKR